MSLKISRILHAGYVFVCGETQIAFDPIFENPFSGNCYAFPNVRFDHEQIKKLKFDAVFISHFHDDHCSLESLNFLDRNTPIYVYCLFEELFSWIEQLGFANVYPLVIDVPILVDFFEVIPRRALDADVDSMFQIKADGLNVLNVVDSLIDTSTLHELAQGGPWDMVLWPFQTMLETDVLTPSRASVASNELPSEWIEQLKMLNPRYVVPSSCQFIQESWSWYNHSLFPISYQQFKKEIESEVPNSRVVRLNPSVSVVLDKDSIDVSSSLSWVQPVGEQDVDYEYKKNITAPSTSDIARHFHPLTATQSQKVYEFCRYGLLEKFRSMECSMDPYFKKVRIWRLSVYDHCGEATHFFYRLKNQNIELIFDIEDPISWSTEISISKFYGALVAGETLTSMYMRINDEVFEPDIEKEIQEADVIEDPLIRCLFNGVFGAYQMVQLKRLQS